LHSEPIWVAGEALIDLLPGRIPAVGGGPANTAKALGSLGLTVQFIGGISNDEFGEMIEKELKSFGVGVSRAFRSSLPTASAEVSFNSAGVAKYEFNLIDTATFSFGECLPVGNPTILYLGSLGTIVEPGASSLYKWANKLSSSIVYDPNIRSSVLSEQDDYRKYFLMWASIASVVKLSDEDLDFLRYSVAEILDLGVDLVVVTHGERGLSGFRSGEEFFIPGVNVDVVDTVGAGDTVGAVLVEGIANFGDLKGQILRAVLKRAAFAAAITCTREGAKPPTKEELER
jgi:fructokinase